MIKARTLTIIAVCLIFVGAWAAKEYDYQKGTLLSMDSASCGMQAKDSKSVAGEYVVVSMTPRQDPPGGAEYSCVHWIRETALANARAYFQNDCRDSAVVRGLEASGQGPPVRKQTEDQQKLPVRCHISKMWISASVHAPSQESFTVPLHEKRFPGARDFLFSQTLDPVEVRDGQAPFNIRKPLRTEWRQKGSNDR
jgi:hypothetical protein